MIVGMAMSCKPVVLGRRREDACQVRGDMPGAHRLVAEPRLFSPHWGLAHRESLLPQSPWNPWLP